MYNICLYNWPQIFTNLESILKAPVTIQCNSMKKNEFSFCVAQRWSPILFKAPDLFLKIPASLKYMSQTLKKIHEK